MKRLFIYFQSLRYRYVLLALALALVVLKYISTTYAVNHVTQQYQDVALLSKAQAIDSLLSEQNVSLQSHSFCKQCDYLIFDGQKNAIAGNLAYLPLANHTSATQRYATEPLGNAHIRVLYYPLPAHQAQNAAPNTLLVTFKENLQPNLSQTLIHVVRTLNILFLGSMILLLGFLMKSHLKKIAKFSQLIDQHENTDLSDIQKQDIPIEIKPLFNTFVRLIERNDESIRMRKQFIEDSAHQLRTPITGVRTQTELALRSNNMEEIKLSLNEIHHTTTKLSRLLTQLLAIARIEPQSIHTNFEKINLAEIARAVAAEFVPIALKKNIDLGFYSTEKTLWVRGNAVLLTELLNNLIDNAIRYTQTNGIVTISITETEPAIHLNIDDNGPGIPHAHREQIFERYYRINDTQTSGNGLGLAIVREIAYAHDAKIRVQNGSHGVGTNFLISFPKL